MTEESPTQGWTPDSEGSSSSADGSPAGSPESGEPAVPAGLPGSATQTPATVPSAAPGTFCFACGKGIDPRAEICPHCGVRQQTAPAKPKKDKLTAALLAIFLGGFGVHKFYLGKTAQGVIYLLFFWTFIPAIVGFIEGILYLVKSDEAWAAEWG